MNLPMTVERDIDNTLSSSAYLKVKVALLVQVPFFASILLDMMTVKVGKFPSVLGRADATAGTDGKTIWFDEDFLNGLALEEACFVMCHEIGHAMWQHMSRARGYVDLGFDSKPFSPELWNIAGDYVINAMLVESKTGIMPKKGLLNLHRFNGQMSVDDVYRELWKEAEKSACSGGGSGSKSPASNNGIDKGDDAGNSQKTIDVHVISQADIKTDEHEWRRAIESAVATAKSAGKLPASLERLVETLLQPQVPWRTLLRFEIARSIGRNTTTWSRPHRRRLVMQKVYLPAYVGHACGDIVVAIDTSGSIGQAELTTFLSEVEGILNTCRPRMVHLLGCDARINSEHTLPMGASLQGRIPALGGGGGTSFVPPFEWVAERGIKPSTLVYLTDMYGTFPDRAPKYPVIWCATSDIAAPFGQRVQINWAAGANDY